MREKFSRKKDQAINWKISIFYNTEMYTIYYKWLLHCNKNVYLTRNWKNSCIHRYVVVQSLSCIQDFATLWTTTCQASPSFTISQNSFKLVSFELMMPSNHRILFPLLLLPSVFFHHEGLFQWVSSSHRVVKVLELQVQHQSMQWIFRVDFL